MDGVSLSYPTTYDLEERNARAGGHWFKPDTMRFFRSRVLSPAFERPDGTVYFATSERCPWGDHPRLYSVRIMRPDGSVDTVGEFQGYRSRSGAIVAAERIARSGAAT